MDGDEARYRFGPLERRGLIAGWRGGQLTAVAGGLVVAVAVLRTAPSLPGVAAALAVVGVAVAVATWPLAGRTAEEWAPDALRHVTATTRQRTRRAAPPFASLEVLPVTVAGGAEAAVVHDVTARHYTCVFRVAGSGFVLLGAGDKAARVGSWATLLSSFGRDGSAVHRLQWVARSLPDDGAAVRRYLDAAGVLDASSAAVRSYRALLQGESSTSQVHDVLLALTVDAGRAGRAVRAAGGGDAGACAVVLREAASLRRLLRDAGLEAGEVLPPAGLAGALRHSFTAISNGAGAGAGPSTTVGPGASAGPGAGGRRWPWPMAVEASWDRTRVDGTWHATYWVAEWPRRDVGPDFLGPLLVSDVRSSLSVVMEPVAALEAARRAEQARTADIADAELRRRGGFLATARRRREEEVLVHRETELADGHAQYRFAGYVTVTATGTTELDDACARVEQAAGRAGLELRRWYGDQARAFTCTLPLGRGLP